MVQRRMCYLDYINVVFILIHVVFILNISNYFDINIALIKNYRLTHRSFDIVNIKLETIDFY